MVIGFEIAFPGKLAMAITADHAYDRTMPLSNLENPSGLCCWCNEAELPTKRHRYCGGLCSESAYIFCYPQSYMSKGYHLMKQGWACRYCGLLFDDLVESAIKRRLQTLREYKDEPWANKITLPGILAAIGVKAAAKMDMDHIKPIFKGGIGLGIRNHQVICRNCHKQKTISER